MSQPDIRLFGRHDIAFHLLPEKGFHLAGRSKADQDPSLMIAHMSSYMRYLARCKQGITGVQLDQFRPNFKDKAAFEHKEPFILIKVEVARRTTFGLEGVFKDQQIAAAMGGSF